MNKPERELTTAEEQVMQGLWARSNATVAELLEGFPEPRPAYNTVSTIVRILLKKGFVRHESEGRGHRYFPLISKAEYSKFHMRHFVNRFFSGNFSQLVSFFAKQDDLSVEEIEQLLKELKKEDDGE